VSFALAAICFVFFQTATRSFSLFNVIYFSPLSGNMRTLFPSNAVVDAQNLSDSQKRISKLNERCKPRDTLIYQKALIASAEKFKVSKRNPAAIRA
jgi:hypothetical protein